MFYTHLKGEIHMNILKLKKINNNTIIKFVIFYCFGLIIFLFLPYKNMNDPDTFWHIKTGEWILHNGIPKADIFSWYGTAHNFKWINHEWLFAIIIYCVHHLSGMSGVYYFSSVLGLTVYFFVYLFSKKIAKNTWIAIFTAIIALVGIIQNLAPRPQIFSFCLFLLLCMLFENKKYISSIPIIIIGVNLHGGVYPIYLILAAYYLFKEVNVRKFLSLITVYTLSILINPYTYNIFLYTIKTFMYDRSYIQEWQPVAITQYPIMIVTIFLILLLTRHSNMKYKDVLFISVFSVFSLIYVRNMVFLYILALPVASKYFKQSISYYYNTYESSLKFLKKLFTVKNTNVKFNLLFAFIFLFILYTPLILKESYQLQKSCESNYPVEAVQYIKRHKEISNIMADYNFGGYLIYNDIPTMVDGRADLFTSAFNKTSILDDYYKLIELKTNYNEFFQTYGAKYVLILGASQLSYVLNNDSDIKLIYRDKKYNLYKL